MKVSELIKLLEESDPDFEVTIYDHESCSRLKIIGIETYPDLSEFEINVS